MIIENPDLFKSWLTSILEPLCDADPAALAKYVYALVKKEKPLDELREGMLDQLDVFLQQETKPFVEMLFKSLETLEYLSPLPETELASSAHGPALDKGGDSENQVPNSSPESRARNRSPVEAPAAVAPAKHRVVVPRQARQPPVEQTLVKVLPLTELLEEPVDLPRRRDRRGEPLREKDDRRRRRSRSWDRRPRVRRHPREDHDRYEKRRPISRSPSPRGRYRNKSPPMGVDALNSRSRSRSPVPLRDKDLDRERDRLRAPRELERDRMSRDRDHRDRVSRSRDRERSRDRSLSPLDGRLERLGDPFKRRCRDFDEKGYCMRGDLCQWDHGADPVVLEDAGLPGALLPAVPEYNPLTPDIWCSGFPPYPPAHAVIPHPPRELVAIPRIRPPPPPGVPMAPPQRPHHPQGGHKNYNHRFAGPRVPLPANQVKCSLEVKKVPRGMNDITHLNNHFSKFGKIVNIQVCFEGDPEGALITFSNPTEANVAYKSTEAVLNNRFIKVFWHNPENKQENTQPANQQKPMDRQKTPGASHNKVLINRENIKTNSEKKLKEQSEQQQQNGNGEVTKKEAVKPADKSRLVTEMCKRAQSLLETQLQQQNLMISRLESPNVTGPQRAALLDAVGSCQEGIEKLRKELLAYNRTLKQMQAKKPKTREEAQKEILDAELDMLTKQNAGQDVTENLKKIAELRRQMSQQFPSHPSMRRPHSRGGRFNTATRFTRGAASAPKPYSVNQTVDHRPRAVLLSGFEADEAEALVQHMAQFGELTGKELRPAVPELVLRYRLRAQAEQACAKGKQFNDRTLSITWVANNKPGGAASGAGSSPARADETNDAGKDDEPQQEISENSLLNFDEEEDDEVEEDRSWRR